MNERVQKTITTVKEFWGRQSKRSKGIYIGGLALVLIIAIVAAVLLNRKEYVVLYEGLETSEAAEMVALIEESGYDCTLRSGGTIIVPKGTEDSIAMTMAMQQYPKSSLTYKTYTDNVGMFTTESEKREYERIAMEERLGAVITKFEGIRDATVTLNIPNQKNTVIEAYKQDSSAAVSLWLDRDVDGLVNEQITGIKYLVMTATGIKEENISLTDNYGMIILPKDTPVDKIAQETKRLKLKTDIENSIKAKVVELLAPAYGEDGFSAAVNIVLDTDLKVTEDTVYTPSTNDERGMLSHTDATQASGYAATVGGVIGVETNADDTYPLGDTNGNGNWTENSLSNTYLVNTYKEQVERDGFVISDVSIAVIIYTDYLPDTTRLNLVQTIGRVGSVNPEIVQDVVQVTNLAKVSDAIPAEAQAILFGLTMDQLIILGAVLLAILLILIIVLVTLSSKSKKKRRYFEKTLLEKHAPEDGEPLVDTFYILGQDGESPAEIPSLTEESEAESKDAIIRKELADFARHSPEIVAQLLRNWMRDEGA